MTALFERWAEHREQADQAPRTKQRYRGVFAGVSAFLGNPDASAVTTADLQRYVEARMDETSIKPLAPRVARDVHRAALSSVYGWGSAKGLVPGNPAEGIYIKVAKRKKVRADELSDAETKALVAAALAIPAAEPARSLSAAKRWCSLLCLYTGSRIGELTQLRKEDVMPGAEPAIRITPEAGSVKDHELRLVPLHPRLAELGFLAFAEVAPDGPLFYDPERTRRGTQTPAYEQTAKDIAAWSRIIGLDDPRLRRPLHAVRHRFMTSARRAGVEEQYVQALAGHSPGTRNRSYGTFPLAILSREVKRLRVADVEGAA